MKADLVKQKIRRSGFLLRIVSRCLRCLRFSTKREIVKRSRMSLFNYRRIAKPLKYYPLYDFPDNNYYGIGRTLSKILDSNSYMIEHGLIFGTLVQEHSLQKGIKIATFSNYRRNVIHSRDCNLSVKVVGPYIKYAKNILDDIELRSLKASLGRILLVFPSHSIDSVVSNFDSAAFISEIEDVARAYDSVLICLYWKDIELGRDSMYIKKGFHVVCAGHSYDFFFLDRLKTFISLADFTMSNAVGTHVGYCISEGKAHYLFKQKKTNVLVDQKSNEISQRSFGDWDSYNSAVAEIENAFNYKVSAISLEQTMIVEKYWGKLD